MCQIVKCLLMDYKKEIGRIFCKKDYFPCWFSFEKILWISICLMAIYDFPTENKNQSTVCVSVIWWKCSQKHWNCFILGWFLLAWTLIGHYSKISVQMMSVWSCEEILVLIWSFSTSSSQLTKNCLEKINLKLVK